MRKISYPDGNLDLAKRRMHLKSSRNSCFLSKFSPGLQKIDFDW